MHNPSRFKGTGVAIITPFQTDLSVDYPALSKVIENVIDGGVDFIVSLGTTGEYIALSDQEAQEVLRFTIEKIDGRCPLVAGCFGGNNTEALVRKIKNFDFSGVDAIMSSSPAYNKPTQDGIFQHYMAIAEASPLPIIIYNVPSRTSSNIAPATVVKLAKASKKFVAVKDASGSVAQITEILCHAPDDFLVLSGDDPSLLPALSLGAHGGISVMANVLPSQCSKLVNATLVNDWATAQQINLDLWPIHHWLYCEGNPVGVKAAMELKGLASRRVRMPLVPLSETATDALKSVLTNVSTVENITR